MPPEQRPPQPPKETRMFRDVPMQAIADMLKTLPVPITITQHLDEQKEKIFYRYQVGETTPDNQVGICMGATPNFLEAVRLSLHMALDAIDGKPPQQIRRGNLPVSSDSQDSISGNPKWRANHL